MSNSQVQINIPKEMISKLVQTEMVRQLGDKEELIRAVVAAAMQAKESRYGGETHFEAAIGKMIRSAATDAFNEWLEENKPTVKAAIIEQLTAKQNAGIGMLVEALLGNAEKWRVHLGVQLKEAAPF